MPECLALRWWSVYLAPWAMPLLLQQWLHPKCSRTHQRRLAHHQHQPARRYWQRVKGSVWRWLPPAWESYQYPVRLALLVWLISLWQNWRPKPAIGVAPPWRNSPLKKAGWYLRRHILAAVRTLNLNLSKEPDQMQPRLRHGRQVRLSPGGAVNRRLLRRQLHHLPAGAALTLKRAQEWRQKMRRSNTKSP
jgi:hypothetical protein